MLITLKATILISSNTLSIRLYDYGPCIFSIRDLVCSFNCKMPLLAVECESLCIHRKFEYLKSYSMPLVFKATENNENKIQIIVLKG